MDNNTTIYAADGVSGKVRNASDVALAEKVIETKKKRDPWIVIEMLVEAWMKRTPEDFKAFKMHVDDMRSDLKDKKFGQTAGGKDMERRITMVFPEALMFMIRSVYKADELPMDREFYREFARRFKMFQLPEKI